MKHYLSAALIAAIMIAAAPAQACRITRPVVVFDQEPASQVPEGIELFKIRFKKFKQPTLHENKKTIEAVVLEGSHRGREVLIIDPLSGPCSPLIAPDWGQKTWIEAWISARHLKNSRGVIVQLFNKPVLEAHGRRR